MFLIVSVDNIIFRPRIIFHISKEVLIKINKAASWMSTPLFRSRLALPIKLLIGIHFQWRMVQLCRIVKNKTKSNFQRITHLMGKALRTSNSIIQPTLSFFSLSLSIFFPSKVLFNSTRDHLWFYEINIVAI